MERGWTAISLLETKLKLVVQYSSADYETKHKNNHHRTTSKGGGSKYKIIIIQTIKTNYNYNDASRIK
jgi:hypothetical protein